MAKNLLSLIALAFSISLIAFTNPKFNKGKIKKGYVTYVYTGSINVSDQRNAANYVAADVSCNGAPQIICKITAPENGDHPDFSCGNPVDNPIQFAPYEKKAFW